MTRTTLWVLRGVAVAAFIGFTGIILVNTHPDIWNLMAFTNFAIETRNLISWATQSLVLLAAAFGGGIAYFLGFTSSYNLQAVQSAGQAFFGILGFGTTRLPLEVIPYFLSSLYFLGFQLFLLVAILAGLTSFFHISGRLVSVCFISMIGITILSTAGSILTLPGITGDYFGMLWSVEVFETPNAVGFFTSPAFIIAIISYIYLEASYQLVYFHSLLEPPALRETQLRHQLTRLQEDAAQDVSVRRQEVPIPRALQRMLGTDAFRMMRHVIEKKLLRREWLVELEDVHEIRRLNTYVNRLFQVDPEAEATITARASAPSLSKMAALSVGSTIMRFIVIISVSFLCIYPILLLSLNAPSIILESVDFLFLAEKTLVLLLPLSLLFPLSATIIGRIRQRSLKKDEEATKSLSP